MSFRSRCYTLIVILCFAGCSLSSNRQEVDFTVIGQSHWLRTLQPPDENPKIIVIQSVHDVEILARTPEFSIGPNEMPFQIDNFMSFLKDIDYQNNVSIVAFRGMGGGTGYDILINSVYLEGSDVNIAVELTSPHRWYDGLLGIQRVEEPLRFDTYKIIVIPRQVVKGTTPTFNMIVDGKIVYHQMISIP